MSEKNMKYLTTALSIIFVLLVITPLSIAYSFEPKDNLDNEIKEYYLNKSFDFFDTFKKENTISIETLIKKGYAERFDELEKEKCNTSNSLIQKKDNIYSIDIICDNYTSSLKIMRKEK